MWRILLLLIAVSLWPMGGIDRNEKGKGKGTPEPPRDTERLECCGGPPPCPPLCR